MSLSNKPKYVLLCTILETSIRNRLVCLHVYVRTKSALKTSGVVHDRRSVRHSVVTVYLRGIAAANVATRGSNVTRGWLGSDVSVIGGCFAVAILSHLYEVWHSCSEAAIVGII